MSGDNLRLDFTSRGGAGAPTLTTPTLTPTTLRNIEQMFLDHESSSILDCPPSPPVVHENAAHFVPPYVALSKSEDVVFKSDSAVNIKRENVDVEGDDDDDDDNDVEDEEDDEDSQETDETKTMYLTPQTGNNIYRTSTSTTLPDFPIPENGAVVRPLPPEIALRLHLDFPSAEAKLSPAAQVLAESSGASSSSATSSRGRRQLNRGAEPTDDEKRRLIRRQRNKEAAARCRKRRVDQTVCLEDEVSQWEERNEDWKREIETLEAQKRHLLSLLDGHRTGECKMGGVKKL